MLMRSYISCDQIFILDFSTPDIHQQSSNHIFWLNHSLLSNWKRNYDSKHVLCVSAWLKWLLFCLLIFSSNYLENPHVFLLSKLLKLVTLEMLEDIEGAGLEAGTLEHAHISIILKKKQKLLEVMIWKKRFLLTARLLQ